MVKQWVLLLGLCLGLAPVCIQAAEKSSGPQGKPYLGVSIAAAQQGEDATGAIVYKVVPDSPADMAGLKKGDVITRIDNRPVQDESDLFKALSQYKAGDKATLHVKRKEGEKDLRVTFGKAPSRREESANDNDEDEDQDSPSGNKKQDKEGGRAQRGGYLGIDAVPVDRLSPAVKKRLKLTDAKGLVVMQVMPDAPADRAGIRPRDLITKIDGKGVQTLPELRKAIRGAGAGKTITLEARRGQEEKKFQAKLAAAPREEPMEGRRPPFPFPPDLRNQIEKLQRQVQQLEKRVRELEQKKGKAEKE